MSKRKKDELSRFEKPGRSKKSMSAQVKKLVNAELRKHTELKGVDIGLSGSTVIADLTTNGSIWQLNIVDLGDGVVNRDGNDIEMRSIRIKGCLRYMYKPHTISGSIWQACARLMLVYDAKPNGVIPNFNDIFQNLSTVGATENHMNAGVKYGEGQRFRVLRDQSFTFNPTIKNEGTLTEHWTATAQPFDIFVPLKGKKMIFGNNATGLISNVKEGAIYLVARASVYDALHFIVDIPEGTARFRYTDM